MEKEIRDIKYGLIAVDPLQEGEMFDVLHFVGYWEEPGKEDAVALREELMTNEEFGLTDIAYRLVILPAPERIIKQFI